MQFEVAYKAAKLGFDENDLKNSDSLTRKIWLRNGTRSFGYFPTDTVMKIVPEEDRKQTDWVVVPPRDDASNRSRVHRNIKTVLGKDMVQGNRANDLVVEIEQWHATQFPTATIAGQMDKLKEEELEFQENDKLSEVADIIIVACGLRMRQSVVGYCIVKQFIDSCYEHRPFYGKNSVNVLDAVEQKMKINRERSARGVWKEIGNGTWKHTDKDDG